MHQHSRDVRGEMRAAAQAGVTTVIELGTYPDDLITHLRAEKGVCDLLSAGSAASAPRLGEHADQAFSHSVESVRRMHTAGVRIVAGTDANATPGSPSPVAHGSSLHDEIDLLHEAGLTNTEALAAATSSAPPQISSSPTAATSPSVNAQTCSSPTVTPPKTQPPHAPPPPSGLPENRSRGWQTVPPYAASPRLRATE